MSFFASSLSLRIICLISAKKDKNIDIWSRKESDRASTMELAYEYVETVKKKSASAMFRLSNDATTKIRKWKRLTQSHSIALAWF